MAGETGTISVSQAQAMVMIAFAAMAYYNTIETFFSIFTTFKRRRGRYFWSMVVSNTGININVIAFVLRYFGYYRQAIFASSIIIPIAWYSMVTGQAIVLWSRLHLVVHSQRKIRLVLAMIIFNAVTMHVPETVIFFLANSNHPGQWVLPFKIYEKVELVVFTVQETVIAGFFLYEGYYSLKPLGAIKPKAVANMVRHLAALFAAVLLLDTGLIVLEYNDKFEIQTMCKPFVYSVKLKVEFVVLNKLLSFTRMSACNCRGPESMPSVTLPDSDNRTTVANPAMMMQALPPIEQTGGSLSPVWKSLQSDRIFDGRRSAAGTPMRRGSKSSRITIRQAEVASRRSSRDEEKGTTSNG
ncbi:integral membrane protein [Colletotrichum plurivorum]|uniref:Integral membrane protein n=1 Tax=Colletotrichum plurivorum TaxID=2175906 RepID=A0A8H6NPT6_9PEZI|nr:integral membrane protein [Colletotrichum plurivorum]